MRSNARDDGDEEQPYWNSSGSPAVWVDRGEVQFTGDQEDDGTYGREPGAASGSAPGGLEQPVDRFERSVGSP